MIKRGTDGMGKKRIRAIREETERLNWLAAEE